MGSPCRPHDVYHPVGSSDGSEGDDGDCGEFDPMHSSVRPAPRRASSLGWGPATPSRPWRPRSSPRLPYNDPSKDQSFSSTLSNSLQSVTLIGPQQSNVSSRHPEIAFPPLSSRVPPKIPPTSKEDKAGFRRAGLRVLAEGSTLSPVSPRQRRHMLVSSMRTAVLHSWFQQNILIGPLTLVRYDIMLPLVNVECGRVGCGDHMVGCGYAHISFVPFHHQLVTSWCKCRCNHKRSNPTLAQ